MSGDGVVRRRSRIPVLRNNTALEIARGLKAFLRLDLGVVRGEDPTQNSVAAVEHERTEQLEKQLSQKELRITKLQERLADSERKNRALSDSSGSNDAWPPIFFVVGRSRSGTNWLMRTLNAHPEVMCRGEGRFFGRNQRRETLKEMQTSEYINYKIQPSSLYNAIADSEYLRLWVERAVWTRNEDPERQLKGLTRKAIYHFLGESLTSTGKRMVGDKTPLTTEHVLQEIGELCPEAKAIHIIRDGRDVSISQLHHKWNRATDEGGVHELTQEERDKRDRYREDPQGFLASGESIFSERLIRKHASGWATKVGAAREQGATGMGDGYLEVRYERLLEDPVQEFGRAFSFLGADASEDLVSRCAGATSFEKRSGGRKRGQEDTKSGTRKGVAGDWKNVFTTRDKEIFTEEAGDLLVELGYEQDDNW